MSDRRRPHEDPKCNCKACQEYDRPEPYDRLEGPTGPTPEPLPGPWVDCSPRLTGPAGFGEAPPSEEENRRAWEAVVDDFAKELAQRGPG